MAGGLEVHNFNFNISLRMMTPDKRGSGKDEDSTSNRTLTESVFTVGDAPIITTTKFHADNDLEDDDADSFTSLRKSTHSHLETMHVNDKFNDAQQEITQMNNQIRNTVL